MKATIQLKPTDGTEPFTYTCQWKDVIELEDGEEITAHDLRTTDKIIAKGKACSVGSITWRKS